MGKISYSKNEKGKDRLAKLSKMDKKIIDYLLDLKDDSLNIAQMSKKIGISRPTIYVSIDKLKKDLIISPQWKLNYHRLGFMLLQANIRGRGSEREAIEKLQKMPAIWSIKRNLNGALVIDVIIKEMDDHYGLTQLLRKMGIELGDYTVFTEELFH